MKRRRAAAFNGQKEGEAHLTNEWGLGCEARHEDHQVGGDIFASKSWRKNEDDPRFTRRRRRRHPRHRHQPYADRLSTRAPMAAVKGGVQGQGGLAPVTIWLERDEQEGQSVQTVDR